MGNVSQQKGDGLRSLGCHLDRQRLRVDLLETEIAGPLLLSASMIARAWVSPKADVRTPVMNFIPSSPMSETPKSLAKLVITSCLHVIGELR